MPNPNRNYDEYEKPVEEKITGKFRVMVPKMTSDWSRRDEPPQIRWYQSGVATEKTAVYADGGVQRRINIIMNTIPIGPWDGTVVLDEQDQPDGG